MDGEQNNLSSHETGNGPARETGSGVDYVSAMEKMPEFGEHMEQIENRGREEGVNEAAVNGSEGVTEGSEGTKDSPESVAESIDPFWQSNPELLEEAKQMNAPLTAKEFKEAGFVFAEEDDGKKHIWATTPEYKKWQEDGGEGKKPMQYESLGDQRYRKSREEYFANLRNQQRANEEYDKKIAERKERLDNLKGNLEEFIKKEQVDIFSGESVDFVYDTLYPDGIKGARDDRIKELITSGLKRSEKDIPNTISNTANNLYLNKYGDAFRNDSTQIPDQIERLEKIKNNLTPNFVYPGSYEFRDAAERVAKPLLEIYKKEKLPNISVKIPSDVEMQNIKFNAARIVLSKGEFFPNTFKNNPENIDGIMAEIGIAKNDNEIIKSALFGYGNKSEGAEIDYFDLKNEVAKRIYGEGSDIYPSDDKERLVFDDWYYGYGRTELSPEISAKAVEKIKDATGKLVERISDDTEISRLMEKDLEGISDWERRELAKMLYDGGNLIDFSHYLNIKKIGISSSDVLRQYIDNLMSKEPLRRFIDKKELREAAPVTEMEVDSNYREILHDGLLERLETGVRKINGQERYLAGIFETESFLENQERLGIDFNDPEIFEPAFNGFMNTLKTRNGEQSEQADWYYENIFANDPGRFLAMVKAFKEESDDVGAKRKITRFFKNNEQAFNDKVKQEVEERFAKEINGEHRAIRTSVLKNAERRDIKKIIDEYKKDVVERVRQKGGEEIDSFTGVKTMSGEREETGTRERKETPFDFSIEKANALFRYGDFIENNVPDANIQWFTDTFVKNGEVSDIFKRDDSYIGFSFKYEGNLCVIAESLDEQAAMYLWRGEPGEDFKEMFDLSKFDAKRTEDPRIVSVNHLDKEHFDESLDLSYKKAFLFFRDGDKGVVNYGYFSNNPARAKQDWNDYQKSEYQAWPLSIDGYAAETEDLERYNAWHERQDEMQARLKEAAERGGQEELEAERRRIVEEEYNRVMNEVV